VDSLGAAFGPGLLACMAADLRAAGNTAQQAADILDAKVQNLLQFFTVDDLNFLKRTGRVSGATAMIGSVLGIKPLLWGDATGHIVAYSKCRGRKKAIDAIVEMYRTRVVDAQNHRIAISHGDCEEEALELGRRICEIAAPNELIICPHEPFTGSHVGPGMLALFFFGTAREI
jgi:DegV family protein with EDD domain